MHCRNAWACDVNETLMRQTIDAFVTLGLKDAGFEYVSMDGECLRLCPRGVHAAAAAAAGSRGLLLRSRSHWHSQVYM